MKIVRKLSLGICVFDSVRWRERTFKITFDIFLVIYTTVQKFVVNKFFYELIIFIFIRVHF